MRVACDTAYDEADLAASADELHRLADAVEAGEGRLGCTTSPGSEFAPNTLAEIEVRTSPGPGVLIRLGPGRRTLVVSGDAAGREALADNLRAMASADDGGHLHLDYFPGHFYLADGSIPLVVNSPHGGMPTAARQGG
ncbi:hypothetical protein [Streptomyces sp. NPDC048659]|uniref:Imm32 family immunity protein n=1 Tax=Streptomyces sp. NPDC048659 TaxID=3155489 RepID=UPI0034139A0C